MTHYSSNPGSVLVQFYKPGGKWYMDAVIDMRSQYNDALIHEAVRQAIIRQHARGESWLDQFIAVVADPYHINAHPIMLQPDWLWQAVAVAQDERENQRRRLAAIEEYVSDSEAEER